MTASSAPSAIPAPFALGGERTVSRLGFGAMRLPTGQWHGPARDPATGRAVLARAVELGVDHIDTAAFYRSGDGRVTANALIREALHPYPAELVIATKVGVVFGDGFRAARPDELRGLVEENLTTLGVDRLDLVYLRTASMQVPHGESIEARFEALTALREEGLIAHLGLSHVDVGHLEQARAIAPVAAVQNEYNVLRRTASDRELLAACERDGTAFVPFGPVGSGQDGFTHRALTAVADRHGVSVTRVALAWLLASSPVVLAIPGTGSVAHLEDNVAATGLVLSDEDLRELSAG